MQEIKKLSVGQYMVVVLLVAIILSLLYGAYQTFNYSDEIKEFESVGNSESLTALMKLHFISETLSFLSVCIGIFLLTIFVLINIGAFKIHAPIVSLLAGGTNYIVIKCFYETWIDIGENTVAAMYSEVYNDLMSLPLDFLYATFSAFIFAAMMYGYHTIRKTPLSQFPSQNFEQNK